MRSNGVRRDEDWVNGILANVFLVDPNTSMVVARQAWKDGKRTYQTPDFDAFESSPVAKPEAESPKPLVAVEKYEGEASTLEKESPAKTFRLTTAQEAREAFNNAADDRIQEIFDAFETQRREGALRGERSFKVKMDYSLKKQVIKLFQEAGYDVNEDPHSPSFYWVRF